MTGQQQTMKLGFIILAHNHPDAVRRLVDLLVAAGHRVVVHFDKGGSAEQLAKVKALEATHTGSVRVLSRVRCVWGEWSLVEAVLVALREFGQMAEKPDYVHLMSGADFPIRPLSDLEEFLRANPSQDFIECCDITQRRWVKGGLSMERFRFFFPVNFRTSRKTFDRLVRWHRKLKIRRRIPLGMTPHMGSQWWTLRWASCQRILDFLATNPKVIRYFRSTWIPDEAFFQTVLAHLIPREEIADLQLMLHHLTPSGRPYVVYPDHLPRLESVPHFFVRKVAPSALDGLEALAGSRRAAIPEKSVLAQVRDEIRGAIDRNYEHHAIVPGHAHGALPGHGHPAAVVFLTTSEAETALIRAHAMSSPGFSWAGCPLAHGGIELSQEMGAATGLSPSMTRIRQSFPEQFIDTLSHALPAGSTSVFVVRFGDTACDPRWLARMPGLRFCSQHAQLLPYDLPADRVEHVAGNRIGKFFAPVGESGSPDVRPFWEIHGFARTDHYFLFHGTVHGTDGQIPDAAFVIPGMAELVFPESVHHEATDSGQLRVLMMFWIDDGAFLEIKPSAPAYLLSMNGGLKPVPLRDLGDLTVAEVIPLLDAFADPSIWSDRLVLESVSRAPDADRFAFFLEARNHWPSEAMGAAIETLRLDEEDARFYGIAARSEITGAPAELADEALAASPETADWHAVSHVVRSLAAKDPAGACKLAIRMIANRSVDSATLIQGIEPCFPRDSKWWPVAMAGDAGLGPEQKADAMNCMGVAAFHKGDENLAELCYRAAGALCPGSQSVFWNLGLLQASSGRMDEAMVSFSRITRHYANESMHTAWPVLGGQAWPATQWPDLEFTLPPGVSEWPRISVVTPSYNQASYLEETIQSVLRQGYPNLQYIVVDGNSNDGSREILERYRQRIDHLVIEPDGGQTEAINKGLKLTDGKLVAWLNSDDVYGPGALFRIALRHLATGADVIAGICAEHRNHTLQVINRPHARNREFHVDSLARIFPNWFAGMFFFQPEVFFTRDLVERVGWLDESLHYAMDYDLWMRFAKAGAKLDVVAWPVAFFRIHDQQKTSRGAECLAEQVVVRDRHASVRLREDRKHELVRQFAALRSEGKPQIAWFGADSEFADGDEVADAVLRVVRPEDVDELARTAASVVCIGSAREEIPWLDALRKNHPDGLIVGWFADLENDPHANFDAARRVDVMIPGGPTGSGYLRHDAAIMLDPIPLDPQLRIGDVISALRSLARDHAAW